MKTLIQIFEDINNDNEKKWAIFKVAYGTKLFVTKVNANKHIETLERVKLSDPKVLKFSEEEARKIIDYNKGYDAVYGIVTSSGIQKIITQGK